MSWPMFFAQTPTEGTPGFAPTTEAPATPAAPTDLPATPATTDAPATPANPTDILASPIPADSLSTPPATTDSVPGTVQPANPPTQDVQYESITTGGLGGMQWVTLVIFAGVCVGLITCVLFSTSKSDLGGAIAGGGATAPFRGKKSGEESLSQLTSWFAMAFIVMSLAMAFIFK